MSEHDFFLVPESPFFTATRHQIESAQQRWRGLSPGCHVDFVFNHPHPMIWNFADIQRIRCGDCSMLFPVSFNVAVSDSRKFLEWWSEIVERMQLGEPGAELPMPCCNRIVARETLYSWCEPNPHFSAFVCSIHEPDIDIFEPDHGPMKDAHLRRIEALLGKRLAQVWVGA